MTGADCKPHTNPHSLTCAAGFANTDFLQSVMQGYGVPFDILPVDSAASPAANLTALLTTTDGSGRYAGLFLYPSLEAIGTLNAEQVAQLRAYQVATGARSVVFGGWATNFGFNPDTAACTSADYPMVFTAAAPLGASGIKATASLASLGLYRWVHCGLSQPVCTSLPAALLCVAAISLINADQA